MENSKFDWGAIIRPTKKCVRDTQMVKEEDYAISLGKSRDGSIILVRENHHSAETWHPSFWELLEP